MIRVGVKRVRVRERDKEMVPVEADQLLIRFGYGFFLKPVSLRTRFFILQTLQLNLYIGPSRIVNALIVVIYILCRTTLKLNILSCIIFVISISNDRTCRIQ